MRGLLTNQFIQNGPASPQRTSLNMSKVTSTTVSFFNLVGEAFVLFSPRLDKAKILESLPIFVENDYTKKPVHIMLSL